MGCLRLTYTRQLASRSVVLLGVGVSDTAWWRNCSICVESVRGCVCVRALGPCAGSGMPHFINLSHAFMLSYLLDWRPIVLPSLCFEVCLSLRGIQTQASLRGAGRGKARGSAGNTDPLRCRCLLVALSGRQRGKSYSQRCGWTECYVCSVHRRRRYRIFWKAALKEHRQPSVKGAFCRDDCWALKSEAEFFC